MPGRGWWAGGLVALSMGGCFQPEIVPVPEAPSYMLRMGGVEVLDGDLDASAFAANEIRMDPIVEGDRVSVMLSGGGRAALYEGDLDRRPVLLTALTGERYSLSTTAGDGLHVLDVHRIVLRPDVEDGLLRFDDDVEIEGEETLHLSWGGTRLSDVRAAAVARVDDVSPTGELSANETMLGGILPWDRVQLELSEPVTRASIEAATASAPLTFEAAELRGQIYSASIRPGSWWGGDPAIVFPDGFADLIPNEGVLQGAGIRRIAEIAPRASFDFEDGDAGVLRASTGEMFVATDGCSTGSCLAFRHPEGPGRSELFARLDGTVVTIRLRVRLLGETSSMGAAPAELGISFRIAPEGDPEERTQTTTIRAEIVAMPVAPYVSDSGWQEVTMPLFEPVAGVGVDITLETSETYVGSAAEAAAGPARLVPPMASPPVTILVDGLDAL